MRQIEPPHEGEQGLTRVLREDLRRKDFKRTLRRDYQELREFFLDENRKKRLQEMGRVKRWLYTVAWLLKSLFLKLTPARRLLLAFAFIVALLFSDLQYSNEHVRIRIEMGVAAGAIVLFVLMLELKDKLLAHSELEAGRAVQLALAPEQSPTVPGWSVWLFTRTANEVGGDLVDFQRISDGKFRIALADVAGKGLSAALLTAKLQATLRALAPDVDPIAETGTKLNRIFYRDSLRNVFASLVYIEVRPESGVLRFVNAGHVPPLHLQASGIQQMPKGDAAIGILADTTYKEHRVELQRGDLLLVYTDGLSDAKNAMGEFFGTQRLLDMLPSLKHLAAQEVGMCIVDHVNRFIGDARVYDDLSLVVLKREV